MVQYLHIWMKLRSGVQARGLIRDAKLDKLLESDELVTIVKESRAFHGWTEGRITFPPTFK